MSHTDFYADRIHDGLQVVFENILRRRVASATIEKHQDRIGMRITPLSDAIPIPFDTVAGKLGGVVRETNVDVAPIAKRIKDAVRNDHAIGPTGEVMVERLEGSAATNSALTKQLPLELFGFGVDRKTGISGLFILLDKLGDILELGIAIGRFASGFHLADLSQSKILLVQPLSNRVVAGRSAQRFEFVLKLRWR